MKEMINFCMTKHEPLIRQLAETPLGGQRFELLIRRYEMNNEPPPPMDDEPKSDKYVTIRPQTWCLLVPSGPSILAHGPEHHACLMKRRKVTSMAMMTMMISYRFPKSHRDTFNNGQRHRQYQYQMHSNENGVQQLVLPQKATGLHCAAHPSPS